MSWSSVREDESVQEEVDMDLQSCDISTIPHSIPQLSEGPNAEAALSKEAPTISSTESEDIVHLDDADQETIKINLDTKFVSKSESFADESSSRNSSTILLSDFANNGKTAEAEVFRGSSPCLPADSRAYSNDSKYKKGGWNAHAEYSQYLQAARRKYVPMNSGMLRRAGSLAVPPTRQYSSGTDSSIQDDSDAPPPPEAAPLAEGGLADDTIADDMERRNMKSTCPDKLPIEFEEPVNPARIGPHIPELLPKHSLTELASSPSVPTLHSRARYQAYVEDVMDEDFAVGAHPNCSHSEDIRGSYSEDEFLMEHVRYRGRGSGLPQFGPSTTKLRFVWYPGSRYISERDYDSSSNFSSRRTSLGSYSDESAYSSDDGGSHSNRFEHLDGADEKGKPSTHCERRSEGNVPIYFQEDEPDSDADDEESRVSDEQEESPRSTCQGMNEKNHWHFLPSGIQKIQSFAVPPTNPFERSEAPECRGERSDAPPLKQVPNTPGMLAPLTLRPVRELDLDQLDLDIPGADENPLVVQPYFPPGNLNALYRHRRYQSSTDGSASAYQRRERRRSV
jgi:hypothetical protein